MAPVPNCSVSCSRCGVVSSQSVNMIGITFQMMDDANELLSKASRQLINAGKNLIDNSRSLPGEQTEDVLEASLHTIEAFRSLLQSISDALEYLINWSDTINDDKRVQNGCCQNEMHPVEDQECPFTEQIKQLAENHINSTIFKVVMNAVANIGSNVSFEDQKRHTPGRQPNVSLQQLEVMNSAFGLTKQAAELIIKASQTLQTGAPVVDKTGLSMPYILGTNTEEVNVNPSFQSDETIGHLEEVRDIIAMDKECACTVLQTSPQGRSTADLLEMVTDRTFEVVNTVNGLQIQTDEFTRLGKENGVQAEKDESGKIFSSILRGAHTVMQEPRNVVERVEQSQQISEEICNVVKALRIQTLEFLEQDAVQIEDVARKESNTGDMVEVAKECIDDVAEERSVAGDTTKVAEIVVWSGSIDVLNFAEDNEMQLGEDDTRKQNNDGYPSFSYLVDCPFCTTKDGGMCVKLYRPRKSDLFRRADKSRCTVLQQNVPTIENIRPWNTKELNHWVSRRKIASSQGITMHLYNLLSLEEILDKCLKAYSNWYTRIEVFCYVRKLLREGSRGLQRINKCSRQLLEVLCKHLNDPNQRVAYEALLTVAELFSVVELTFESSLQTVVPRIFSCLTCSRDSVRTLSKSVLAIIEEIYGFQPLLPALLRSLDELHPPRAKVMILDFATAACVKSSSKGHSAVSTKLLHLWLAKLALLSNGKDSKLKEAAIKSILVILTCIGPSPVFDSLLGLSLDEKHNVHKLLHHLPLDGYEILSFFNQSRTASRKKKRLKK